MSEEKPPTEKLPESQAAPETVDIVETTAHEAASAGEAPAGTAVKAEPPRGIGFLGRRGTAPILTAEGTDNKTDTGQAQSAAASEPQKAAQKPSVPSAPPEPPSPPKPGMAEHAFRAMSYAALLFLLLFLLVQTAAGIYFPSTYWPEEKALAEAYEAFVQSGQWLLPPSTEALPASLPGYFWFMGLIDAVPMLPDAFYLPVVTSVSAFVALLGVYVLGLCTGLGNRVAFAAGLILLSSLGFVPLTHWVAPDLLLAGLLALSLGFLYKGWVSPCSFLWTGLGFVLAGVAMLVGGLPALWIPLIGSCAFVIWRGNFRRAHKLDAVLGFGLLLLCIVGWVGAVILRGGEKAQILQPLREQFLAPFQMISWPLLDYWWLALSGLALALLPWIAIPLFVSWGRVLGNAWTDLKASRTDKSGGAWLWICLATGLLLVLCTPRATTPGANFDLSLEVYLLPIAALLLAKALLNLSHTGSRLFFLLLALLCLVAGVALTAVGIPVILDMVRGYLPPDLTELLIASDGLPLLGGILLLGALTLSKLTNRAYPGGALAVFVLLITMLVQPATLLTAPSWVSKGFAQHLPKGVGIGVLPGREAPRMTPAIPPTESAPSVPTTPESTLAEPVAAPAVEAPAVEAPPLETPPASSEPPVMDEPQLAPEAAPAPTPEAEQKPVPEVSP